MTRVSSLCARCCGPLDRTVHHDDTPEGWQLCEHCCPTCNPHHNKQGETKQ